MGKYTLAKLYSLVLKQADAASSIPELRQALTALRNVAKHLKGHKDDARAAGIAHRIAELTQALSAAVIAEDARKAQEKIDERIARDRSPAEMIKRVCPSKTMPVLRNRPDALKHCVVAKMNRRYELRWMSKSMLLAERLTRRELMDLKWFAATHFSPITWIGDLPE
jgi:hypothetical protein